VVVKKKRVKKPTKTVGPESPDWDSQAWLLELSKKGAERDRKILEALD